jgi:hypothetical protein
VGKETTKGCKLLLDAFQFVGISSNRISNNRSMITVKRDENYKDTNISLLMRIGNNLKFLKYINLKYKFHIILGYK